LRILKNGFRKGDNAPLALVSLMDRPDLVAGQGEAKKSEKKEAAKAA
jgi:large subunit ribosomal protein L17